MRDRANSSVLTAALDTLVAVLVERCEVLPQFPIGLADAVVLLEGREFGGQDFQGLAVEFVLV